MVCHPVARAASHLRSADMRVMWKAATTRMRPTRQSKGYRSHMQIGQETRTRRRHAAPSATWICVVREIACYPSSPLAIPALCVVRSATCGCVRPALCPSTFRARSNRSGGHPCFHRRQRARSSHRYLSCALCTPAEFSLWPYPRAPLDGHDDIVELHFGDTTALSGVDAFERRQLNGTAGTARSTRKRIGRGSATRSNVLGVCPERASLPTSTPGCRTRQRFWGDLHNHR